MQGTLGRSTLYLRKQLYGRRHGTWFAGAGSARQGGRKPNLNFSKDGQSQRRTRLL
jgi:hypothetical protein